MRDDNAPRIGGTKRLLAEEVFRHIGNAIVRGELAPRDRIRDADLALRLHVSRTPVREALQRLERIGLVTMYPSRYTEVTEVTPAVIADSREFAGFQSGFVAHLAASRMTASERRTAVELVDVLIDVLDEPERSAFARRDLFSHLSACSGNALQHSLLDEASFALNRNLKGLVVPPERRFTVLAACSELRNALRTGDPAAAERAARELYGIG